MVSLFNCTVFGNTIYHKSSEWLSFRKLVKGCGRIMKSVLLSLHLTVTLTDPLGLEPTLLYCLKGFDLLGWLHSGQIRF